MLIFRVIFGIIWGYFSSRHSLVLENAFLRYQVGVLKRSPRRPIIRYWDRPLLVWFSKKLPNWKGALYLVQPETLVRWHRLAFKFMWGRKTGRNPGRSTLPPRVIKLIREIAYANPLWGAPRIHGELLKLGVKVSQSSVEKYLKRTSWPRPINQNWKTFIRNHSKAVIAMDFFMVPTIWFQRVYVLVILSHDRRKILDFAVTLNPSPRWTAQQLRNAHSFEEMPKYVLHDRDRNFWGLKHFGFTEIITAHKCPWQNAYVERVIGTVRRECTDHIIVFNVRQLERVLREYKEYYNHSRTHLSLNKDSPVHRRLKSKGRIVKIPKVGGLHYEFKRVAA